jgi:hypothetical protein
MQLAVFSLNLPQQKTPLLGRRFLFGNLAITRGVARGGLI